MSGSLDAFANLCDDYGKAMDELNKVVSPMRQVVSTLGHEHYWPDVVIEGDLLRFPHQLGTIGAANWPTFAQIVEVTRKAQAAKAAVQKAYDSLPSNRQLMATLPWGRRGSR
jgi:hypothetical protein